MPGTAPPASLFDPYLRQLRETRRLSPHTLEATARDLAGFAAFSGAEGIDPIKADSADVRGYVAWRGRQGLAAISIRRELSSLRGWFRYLIRQDLIQANPAVDVRGPKPRRKLPEPFTGKTLAMR